jgi:hypothetical protein
VVSTDKCTFDKQNEDGVVVMHFGQALQNFSQDRGHDVVGGCRWTWKKLFNEEPFTQEVIWLSTRLISSNVAQFIVTVFVLIISGINLSIQASEAYDKEQAKSTAGEYITLATV